MVGGLINVVTYVSSDLYLTGAPQITFYKMVYRRYTNFALESVVQEFDNNIDFNRESELVPDNVADLIHKSYLRIKVPRFQVTKADVGIDMSDFDFSYANDSIVSDFQNVKNIYTKVLIDIYRIIYKAVNAINVNFTGLMLDVQAYVNTGNNLQLLADYDALLQNTRVRLSKSVGNPDCILDYAILDPNRTNFWKILQSIDVTKLYTDSASNIDTEVIDPNSQEYTLEVNKIMKDSVFKYISNALSDLYKVQDLFFTEYKTFLKQIAYDKDPNMRFAWVRNLGFSIIDYLDVFIGGRRIDRHYGIWMNIWYELTHTEAQKRDFREMIGDVSSLTNFDTLEKPEYTMYIPLSFWFNRFSGLSFPLLAMQYNTLRFKLKLKKMEEVCFVEKVYNVEINGTKKLMTASTLDFYINRSSDKGNQNITLIEEVRDISIEDIFYSAGKRLDGSMLLDFVYLESPERKKFAQSGHEYLIERMQYEIYDNVDRVNFTVKPDFVNPSKELIWVFQKDAYNTNLYSTSRCRWNDFTIGTPHKNPVVDFSMEFNGYTRVRKQVGRYFDKLQPLYYHNNTPDDGINIFSFCIDPMQSQPTGSCNMSKITEKKKTFTLDSRLFIYTMDEIYPYDQELDFILTLQDPKGFAATIDIRYIRNEIRGLENITQVQGLVLTASQILRLEELQNFEEIYTRLSDGTEDIVQMSLYRKIPLITTAKCYIFDLSLNILRMIGGYGALAYSGKE